MKPFTEDLKFTFDGLTADSICVDAGAHEGNWSYEIWRRYKCKIVALEPMPEYISKAYLRLAGTGALIIPLALHGRSGGSDTFYSHGAMSGPFSDGAPQIVGNIGLPDLMMDLSVPSPTEGHDGARIAVLKLNIEGGEYSVLESILECSTGGKTFASYVDNIIVQPHPIVPDFERRWKAIQEGLAKTHECVFMEKFCWEGWRLKP